MFVLNVFCNNKGEFSIGDRSSDENIRVCSVNERVANIRASVGREAHGLENPEDSRLSLYQIKCQNVTFISHSERLLSIKRV